METDRSRRLIALVLVALAAAAPRPAAGDLFGDLGLTRPDPNMGRRPDNWNQERPERGSSEPRQPSQRDIRRAEEAARERQQKLEKEWLPAGKGTVTTAYRTVSTVPDPSYFNAPPAAADSFLAPIARVGMNGTQLSSEGLHRAASILTHLSNIKDPVSPEDVAFLASQAALAMEGAPIQLIVSEPDTSSRIKPKNIQPIVVEMGNSRREVESAGAERVALVKEYNDLKIREKAGESVPGIEEKRAELSKRYTPAVQREAKARETLKKSTQKFVIEMVDSRKKKKAD